MSETINVEISNDWFCLYHGDGRLLSDACVEGPVSQLDALAKAIESRGECYFRRCAARPTEDGYEFWSPRNSMGHTGRVSLDTADSIAAQIREWQRQNPSVE